MSRTNSMSRKSEDKVSRMPALTPEAKENRLISLSMDLAERQLLDGTASSQVITHFLKLGSSKEQLEQEVLKYQKELIKAKAENIQSSARSEELYKNALKAMRLYSGGGAEPIDEQE